MDLAPWSLLRKQVSTDENKLYVYEPFAKAAAGVDKTQPRF
jgi:hypothetical protein